jgi:Spy/CpxP family protein refolding chaperone
MDTNQDETRRSAATDSCAAHHAVACGAVTRHRSGPRGGVIRLLGFGLLVGALGFFAGRAMAHDGGFGGRFFGGDPDRAEARIEKMARHLAVEADATPAQQEKLAEIARAAAKDVAPLREKMRGHREKTMALLAAPSIDRAAVEALRAEQMADADALSRRIAQAAADAAEVLTPEQRQKLAAHMAEKRSRHGRHGRGGGDDGEGRGPWSIEGEHGKPRG